MYYRKTAYCTVSVDSYVTALRHLLEEANTKYRIAKQKYDQQLQQSNPQVEEARKVLQEIFDLAQEYWSKNLTGKLFGNVEPPQDRIAIQSAIRLHKKNWEPISESRTHELLGRRMEGEFVKIYVDSRYANSPSVPYPSDYGINELQQAIDSFKSPAADKVKMTAKEAKDLGLSRTDFLDTWYE